MEEPLPSKTTAQEDLTAHGQRQINKIWEITQAIIALMVVIANMVVGVSYGLQLKEGEKRQEYPFVLSSALFLIVGFYFSRTNHAAIGGVGPKPNSRYEGR